MRKLTFARSSFLVLFFVSAFAGFGQSETRLIKSARKSLSSADYTVAKEKYSQLNQLYPNNPDYLFEAGLAYYYGSANKSECIEFFEQSLKYATKDTLVEAYYYLGKAYQSEGNHSQALLNYEKYKPFLSDKKSTTEVRKEVEYAIETYKNAERELTNSRNLIVKNLGPNINSAYGDYTPVISLDQTALFFTSRRLRADSSNLNHISSMDGMHFEDAYVSYKDPKTGEWLSPQLLDFSKPDRHDAVIGVSADNQVFFVFIDKQKGDIYFSENPTIKYAELESLGSDINSSHRETHATMSADGRYLYFVSNRPGGVGGRDIYRCVRLPDGKWSKAQNLGAPVNTEYDEEAPFLHPDGKTLFFSSKNRKTMGGFDIFFTQIQPDGTWAEPQNMGHPINTPGDDVFFSTSADGKMGYFASAREDGYGEKDLYMVVLDTMHSEPIAICKGFIINDEDKELPEGVVIWVNDLTHGEGKLDYRPRLRDGGYVMILSPCAEYQIEYMFNAEIFHNQTIKVPCEVDYHERNEPIMLVDVPFDGEKLIAIAEEKQPVTKQGTGKEGQIKEKTATEEKVGEPVSTSTAVETAAYQRFYGYNQKGVKVEAKEYKQFMKQIEKIINLNGTVILEIEASASTVPTQTYVTNENLAQKRVETAKEMILQSLKSKGIDESKVQITKEKALVSGPPYNNDARSNAAVYGKYQYVKILAK